MLTVKDIDIEQRPRKKVKLDVERCEDYDQFKGQAMEIQGGSGIGERGTGERGMGGDVGVGEEMKLYGKVFEDVKKNPRSHKKLEIKSQKPAVKQEAKQESTAKQTKPTTKTPEKPQKKPQGQPKSQQISSNWKKFLEKSHSTQTQKQKQKSGKYTYQFVAIDCEFVKSGQQECLARVSLVNQHGDQLYDSYVKPTKKITDFVTEVSGITYSHIKNAPNEDHVIPELKRKMLNKIIIGHTIDKDLTVCGLKQWTGFKKIIDIADTTPYSPGGKRLALKKLAFNHLGKVIQEGWHSSIEDAQATMQLFLKHKQDILKERKIVRK